ncbi:histidine kinase [Actinoallomurus bryophytorum]|uniref:histidine kinase n=1 Tax=Actinoallomurus bryophytorum TaxID=1490222 RepID=A0A543CQ72_9ACTN|nr:histidine kinase [Actinoallomurus bryophytorum]TQL99251.1 signal transduction histidine kinase [Actinoallomurus bryophytorum]
MSDIASRDLRQAVSGNRGMLRVANLTARAVGFVLVGVFTFAAHGPGTADVAVQIAVFTVTAVLMVVWALADRPATSGGRYAFLLPYVLGAITVMCGVASATPGGGNFIVLSVIAALSAGSGTSLAAGWIVVGLGVAAIEAAGLALGATAWVTVEYPGYLLVALLMGFNRRTHRVRADQSAALLAKSERLREEQAAVAALEERARIAREIHDVLAHSLGALGVHIQLTRAVLTDRNDVAQAVERLDQAHRMAADGLSETRRAVQALRGETLPLPEGLERLSADHRLRHDARVTFEVKGVPRPLPPDAGLALARIAQEALVNTAKHAPNQPVEMRLDYADADTSLVVVNPLGGDGDREGGLATANAGYGLTGMRERLLLLDGTLSAGRNGNDWVVMAKVPR